MKFPGVVGGYDPYTRSIKVIASTINTVKGVALTKWNLERYSKNPVVLWSHDTTKIPVGLSLDVVFDEQFGLTATIFLGSEKANPFTVQLSQAIAEGLVRACSVGFTEEPDGGATLDEISLVSVGADEDAGTSAINAEVIAEQPRTDASGPWTTTLDADEPPPCLCACTIRRGASGRVENTDACSCTRTLGIRVDEHGDPKVITEPCEPTEQHTDADDDDPITGVVFKAGTQWGYDGDDSKPVQIDRWHVDAAETVPVYADHHEHEEDRGRFAIGRARIRLDAHGDVRTTIDLYGNAPARAARDGVRRGKLFGLSPKIDVLGGVARVAHVILTSNPRNPLHRIDSQTRNTTMTTSRLDFNTNLTAEEGADSSAEQPSGKDEEERKRMKRSRRRLRNRIREATGINVRSREVTAVQRAFGGSVAAFNAMPHAEWSAMFRAYRSKQRALTPTGASLEETAASAIKLAADTAKSQAANPGSGGASRTDAAHDPLDVEQARARRDAAYASAWMPTGMPEVQPRTDAHDDTNAVARLERARAERDLRAHVCGRTGGQ